MKTVMTLACFFFFLQAGAQETLGELTVQKIMRDPKWIGTSPSAPRWTVDGQYLFFNWNPDRALSDSTYFISLDHREPQKASYEKQQSVILSTDVSWNSNRSAYTYEKNGDIF